MKKIVDQLNETTNYVLSGSFERIQIYLIIILNNLNVFFIQGGKAGQKTRERHTSRGKLLARDRIKYLLDPKYKLNIKLKQLSIIFN